MFGRCLSAVHKYTFLFWSVECFLTSFSYEHILLAKIGVFIEKNRENDHAKTSLLEVNGKNLRNLLRNKRS